MTKSPQLEESAEYKTCNTLLASYILFRTRCRYRLIRDGGKSVYISLAISQEQGEELESDFATCEAHQVDAIKRALTDRIRHE